FDPRTNKPESITLLGDDYGQTFDRLIDQLCIIDVARMGQKSPTQHIGVQRRQRRFDIDSAKVIHWPFVYAKCQAEPVALENHVSDGGSDPHIGVNVLEVITTQKLTVEIEAIRVVN